MNIVITGKQLEVAAANVEEVNLRPTAIIVDAIVILQEFITVNIIYRQVQHELLMEMDE